MAEAISEFLTKAVETPASAWCGARLREVARAYAPDRLFGLNQDILKADIHRQWASWFMGTVCDVKEFIRRETLYPEIYAEIKQRVTSSFTEMTQRDAEELASKIAQIASAEAERIVQIQDRKRLSKDEKQDLVNLADGKPRCWVCGYEFSEAAVSKFLGEYAGKLPLPPLVDILKPIGLRQRDVRIEVDHVVPYSQGGGNGDNLQIACGWCNANKSDKISIYSVSSDCRSTPEGAHLGTLPQPFWVVRLLALSAERNETRPDEEITVAPRNAKGLLNPANLIIVGYRDDPLGPERFQSREAVAELWGVKLGEGC